MLSVALLYLALFMGARMLLLSHADDPYLRAQVSLALWVAFFITVAVLAVVFAALYFLVFSPLKMLIQEVRIISGVNPGYLIELSHPHLLGDIPKVINELGGALMKARREITEAVSASSSDMENSKSRLETILTSLKEGIIVCDSQARIMFYNPEARRVFQENAAIGLGRSLFQLVPPAPIDSSLAVLRQRRLRHPEETDEEQDISFVCSTLLGTIVSCRIRLLPVVPGLSWSFLFSCEDISREADAWGRRENLLRASTREMQTLLTSLSLSADSLEMMPDLDADRRATLDQMIIRNTRSLTSQFDVLSREIKDMESSRYLVNDVYTEDIVACVARRLEERGVRLTMIGDPLWVKADVHSLLLLLEFLASRIHEYSGAATIEAETLLGDKRVYLNYYWHGHAVPEAEIRRWKASIMEPSAVHTVAEVLERLDSELWSSPHDTTGFAVLRLPLPYSTLQWEVPLPKLPSRPVYTDFSADEDTAETDRLRDLPLNRIPFVVFDTETTGLAPLDGDEIISLAGVKIVKRGIVVGETFDQLVDPRRPIPQSSVRFHGITDNMVTGKPAIEAVLRSFHAFVGDAVLVGHNAAFDMRFIRMKERRAGVSFRGPVLDTLSLSLLLHDHTPEHSLDAVARRLGVEVRGRHTAIGDSIITAQIFIKFLYLLQQQGITTLGQMLEASKQ